MCKRATFFYRDYKRQLETVAKDVSRSIFQSLFMHISICQYGHGENCLILNVYYCKNIM